MDFNRPPGRAEANFRRVAVVLWIFTAVVEVALIARFICMWLFGVNATGGAGSTIVTDLYLLTNPIINPLAKSANVYLPPAGLGHVFDVACFLAIDVLFFGMLGITKFGIWGASKWDERRERKAVLAGDVANILEPDVTVRVPVDSSAG